MFVYIKVNTLMYKFIFMFVYQQRRMLLLHEQEVNQPTVYTVAPIKIGIGYVSQTDFNYFTR